MMDIAGAVREVFKFLGVVLDPKKKKEAYQLYLSKERRRALEHAEKYILNNKELLNSINSKVVFDKDETKLEKKIKYHEKKFWKHN